MREQTSSNSQTASSFWITSGIVFCFFFSGLTSLALETAWSKYLSYLLGTDLYGAATTIVAYMGGLGLGALVAARLNERFKRPMHAYAWLQIAIGVMGLLSVPMLLATQPVFEWLYGLSSNRLLFLFGRFLVTFALLLPATTLMGMTLPVVIGAYGALRERSAASAGLLYGVNTLGAVAGTLVAGFGLISRIGLTLTCVVAGVLDLTLALVAYLLARTLSSHKGIALADTTKTTKTLLHGKGVAAAVLLSGATALALELCWFRLLGQVIGPSVHAFSVTLAVFLMGVGLGSLIASRLLPFFRSGDAALFVFLVATVLLTVAPIYYLDRIPGWYKEIWAYGTPFSEEVSLMLTQGLVGCTLMLPATLATGAVFPAAIRAYGERYATAESVAAISGRLFFLNTIGSLLGTLLWAFWIVPAFGVLLAIQLATSCSLIAAIVVLVTGRMRLEKKALAWGLGALSIVLPGAALAAVPLPNYRALHEGVFYSVRSESGKRSFLAKPMHKNAKILFAKDGLNASVTVVSNRHGSGGVDLAFSGKWVASTHLATRRSLHLLGHLPMLLAKKQPETALVIGLGTGITSGGLLLHDSLKQLDIVEIEPAVADASDFFADYNHSPLKDPRTSLILQDGRTFMAFGSTRYDVITSDPIHPWVKGAANLYTREYYEHVVRRLSPGGIFCQWIPSTMSVRSFNSILLTLRGAFPEMVLLFAGPEAMAFGALQPIEFDPEVIRARMANPAIGDDMRDIHMQTPEQVIKALKTQLKPVPVAEKLKGKVNTDDNVFLEHQLPWDMFHGARVRMRLNSKSN